MNVAEDSPSCAGLRALPRNPAFQFLNATKLAVQSCAVGKRGQASFPG